MASSRELWQMFTDVQPGSLRRTWLELTANVIGSVGLHIEAIVLGESTRKKDENARLGFAAGATTLRRSSLAQPGEMIHAESKNTDRTCLQRLAP
jgi:hypothetical protein